MWLTKWGSTKWRYTIVALLFLFLVAVLTVLGGEKNTLPDGLAKIDCSANGLCLQSIEASGESVQVYQSALGFIVVKSQEDAVSTFERMRQVARKFEKYFGIKPEQGLVYDQSFNISADRFPVAWVQPWAYSADSAWLLTEFLGRKGNAAKDTKSLAHEIGHLLFMKYIWGKQADKPQYGGDAPDWLDEVAGILMEGHVDTEMRIHRMNSYFLANRTIALQEFFEMSHPLISNDILRKALEDAKAKSRAKTDGEKVVFKVTVEVDANAVVDLFYAQSRLVADFLLEETNDPQIFGKLARSLKEGRAIDETLPAYWCESKCGVEFGMEQLDKKFSNWLSAYFNSNVQVSKPDGRSG